MGLSITHLSVLFFPLVVASAFACGMILKRVGFSPFWGILAIIPLVNLIAIWFLALAAWPIEKRQ